MLAISKGQHGRWAVLSHRWGIGSTATLREDTLDTQKSGISISSLPATFQDAIKLTRFLGPRYLWIDSLCIIQDSVADWQTESATMPGIYQNAFVTIAAASTKDSHGGIFVERAWAKHSMPCVLPVKSLHDEGTVTINLPLTHSMGNGEINYLNSRGMVFPRSAT
jgi:hypothetical protein